MGERLVPASGLHGLKTRIDGLVARLHRTSFRDRLEREILVAELGRTIASLPSARHAEARAFTDGDSEALWLESLEAVAAVQGALRALSGPERTDAWRKQMARLEDHLSVLLAAEEDLLELPVPAPEAAATAPAA
jgi:hypothetical protein